ncbi:MAG TPA: YgiT-type zinc finger protein, partial [Phycisphaerae bacterium]|nr:YgiT-type zinc finger protein [Phycisphaerae bacterium]
SADIDESVCGIHIRMLAVPGWVCPNCGEKQVTLPVARYISEFLKRLLTDLPNPPGGFGHPLTPKEIVFTAA